MDPEGCARFAGPGPLNTDDRLLLEFRAGRHRWSGDPARNRRLVTAQRPDPAGLLDAPPSAAFADEVAATRALDEGLRAHARGSWARAVEAFSARVASDAEDVVARRLLDASLARLAREDLDDGRVEDAVASARTLLAREGVVAASRLDAAAVLRDSGLFEESRAVVRDVLRARPWPRARRLAD
jgi:hypothetical protein